MRTIARCNVVIMPRSVVSMVRLGSDRKLATPASVLSGLRVQNMENGADEQGVAGLFPMIAPLERAFGINQDVGDILHIAHLAVATPHFKQRVISERGRIGGIEQQHATEACTPSRGQLPVLTLDVMDDATARQVNSVGTTRPTPLPLRVGAKQSTCSRPLVTQISVIDLAEHHSVGA